MIVVKETRLTNFQDLNQTSPDDFNISLPFQSRVNIDTYLWLLSFFTHCNLQFLYRKLETWIYRNVSELRNSNLSSSLHVYFANWSSENDLLQSSLPPTTRISKLLRLWLHRQTKQLPAIKPQFAIWASVTPDVILSPCPPDNISTLSSCDFEHQSVSMSQRRRSIKKGKTCLVPLLIFWALRDFGPL